MRNVIIVGIVIMLFLAGCNNASEQDVIVLDTSEVLPESEMIESEKPIVVETVHRQETEESVNYLDGMVLQEEIIPVYDRIDTDFVAVRDYIPDVLVDLKYAQPDNFTGHTIYEFHDVYLRYGTVMKLVSVQQELKALGLGIKIWDGFRPIAAQFKLWEICPDDTYVANPNVGFSNHSRGFAVDLTLVDSQGNELLMPTEFDDFSGMADRNYSDCDPAAAENAILLQNLMEKYGFSGYYGEWWHFNDTTRYEVEHCFDPAMISQWYADCEEFISLRTAPDTNSDVILRIPSGGEFTRLGKSGDFFLVEYQGRRGYVHSGYTMPVGDIG